MRLCLALVAACSYAPERVSGIDELPTTDGAPQPDSPVSPIDATVDAPPAPPVTVELPVTADTYVDSVNPNVLHGSLITMLVDGAGSPSTALWRVDLTSVPTTATVTTAELLLTVASDTGSGAMVFEMLESWSETNAIFSARDSGMAWSGAGATPPSRGVTAIGGPVAGTPSDGQFVVPINSAVVGKWVQTPASNFGAALVNTLSNGTTYRTRNDAILARRPILRITYQP